MSNIKIRDNKGRFTVAKKITTVLFSLVMIGAVMAIAYCSQIKPTVKYVDKVVVLDTTSHIIEQEKSDILDVLQNCESKGNSNAIAWEDYGTGKNRASFGAYMLKVGTVQAFVKGLTDFQSIALASDAGQSRKLAETIIFSNDGGIYNWKNCMDKNGLLARVNFVKTLELKSK